MLTSLSPNLTGVLLGNTAAPTSSFGVDPLQLNALVSNANGSNSSSTSSTPVLTPQQQELQTDQNRVTGLGQLLSDLTSFQTALQNVEQATGSDPTAPAPTAQSALDAAQQFVDAYNTLVKDVSSLTGTSGSLAGDMIASSLQKDLASTESSTSSGVLGQLDAIGITANSDGTLSLDPTAFQAAYANDPTDTTALLNQGAQSLDQLAGQYAGGGGPVTTEMDALTQNEQVLQSVADNTAAVQSNQQQQQSDANYAALLMAELYSSTASSLTQQTFGTPNLENPSTLLPQGSTLSTTA